MDGIFNVRVYGILLDSDANLLLVNEKIAGQVINKFPGGGLEYGEGTRECLIREFKEELDLPIEVGDHIYTTDFFQQSAFHIDHQILSIYYKVGPIDWSSLDLNSALEGLNFYWRKIQEVTAEELSMPIDKKVLEILKMS